MEMASAHGLALKLVEMNRLERISRNELCEIISEEDKIIKLWHIAYQSRFSKKEFFTLMRKTILFVLSPNSLKELKKKELLKGASMYLNKFSTVLKNSSDIRKPFIDVIVDPWKNKHFSWEELFQKRINFCDLKVQQYFHAEPEEIVLARVHFFSSTGKDDMSMILARNSFLFHCRIAKTFKYLTKCSKTVLHGNMTRKGIASMDWYLHNLRRKKSLIAVYNELKQLTCHEGVLLIMRLRGLKFLPYALSVVQILLMHDLIHPSTFCCTKKLFTLWALLHKEKETPVEDINEEIRKMVAVYAPSSSHFYLLVDVLWEQFGMSFVNIYVELYIRGLTSDLNLLEAAKHQDKHEDMNYLESHISSMFYKLSTLFIDFHQRVARECMFSAFSLKPTTKMLYILQSMTHGILSDENEMMCDSSFNHSIASVQECKCAIKCTGLCKSVKEHALDHPILMKGIPNIPYSVVKDLVSVLESVRCFRFQYNVFDWRKNATDLGDYLRDFTLCKSYESDTECEEDSAPVIEPKSQSENINTTSIQPTAKRKSDSCDLKQTFPFEMVGANIEVQNEEFVNKRMKTDDHSQNIIAGSKDILNTPTHLSQKYNIKFSDFTRGMEDAIENVIRATLDNNKQKSVLSLDKSHPNFSNASFRNDESENLSSLYKHVSENHIYPYSLTNYGKDKSLNPGTSFNSETENLRKYNYFPPSTSVLSRALTSPPVNRRSVISPTLHLQKNSSTMQEQSSRQTNQNNYFLKSINDPYYNKSKDIQTDASNSEKTLSIYQQGAQTFGSKNSLYGQNRNVSSAVSESSQYVTSQTTMQVVHRSNVSSDFTKEQFLTNTPVHSASSCATSPLNLTQTKQSTVQSPQLLPVNHHHVSKASSVYRTDSRFPIVDTVNKSMVKRINESMCYQDNQLVHCDRSSVIQHTMQHVKENNSQIRSNEVEMPNQLAVSVNSDAVEQIRNVPKKDITNLPPFKVNVSDRSISSSSLAVSANLVIARKPHPQNEVPSQPVSTNVSPVTSDIITIPGILASPSVIVSPWEAQRKVHGEMMYKKNSQIIAASTIDKRIYKNRPPYGRPVTVKSESKMIGQKHVYDKNNNSQIFKAVPIASHNSPNVHPSLSTNQSNPNTSQNLIAVNKSSSQVVSQTASSQPWYSEPYPKPHGSRNVSSTSTANSVTIEKNTIKIFQPPKNDPKSFAPYSKQMLLSKNQSTVLPAITSLSHSTNNPTSEPSVKSHLQYINTFTVPSSSISSGANTAVSVKSNIASSSNNNIINVKTYSSAVKNNPVTSSNQLSNKLQLDSETNHNKNSVIYSATNIINNSLHFPQASPRALQISCCSPSELNPCQNCSLSPENHLKQETNEKTLSDHPNNIIPSHNKMMLENVLSAPCSSSFPSIKEEQSDRNRLNCPHCENPFSETELNDHILNCTSKNLNMKNNSLVNEINSSVLVAENFCANSLSGNVPEHNTFFEKETFLHNLPQTTKPFMNMDDDKNLDEIDANAFSTCMDLINSDKDLERIVQGIDSLDQIDNNYLPYMQPADPAENFLSNNLCNDIQKDEKPLQNSTVCDKINEINNYSVVHESPELEEKKLSVFDFTESKSVLQPIYTKPQVSYTENIPTNTSKNSSEMSFSTFAEIFKHVMTGNSTNEFESSCHRQYQPNCPEELESTDMCLKNDYDLNTDINQIPPVNLELPIDQNNLIHTSENIVQQNKTLQKTKTRKPKFKYSCSYCLKTFRTPSYVKKHIPQFHPGLPESYNKICISSDISTDMLTNNLKSREFNSSSGNSYHTNTNPYRVLDHDIEQNFLVSDTLENGSTLPKGKVKGVIKNQQTKCKICGKILTVIYLKKHMITQHKVKLENSNELNSEINENPPVDSSSPVDSVNMSSVSPLLEQDFDSSTCLSASDALKKNTFTVTETTHNSENSAKLAEKMNVKFNFNVLEFSKDVESDSKIISVGNVSLQHKNLPLESVQKFETGTFSDVPHTKSGKQKQSCDLCGKFYHSKGTLNRHIKDFHKKNFMKKREGKKVKNSKIQENQLRSCTVAKETSVRTSKKLPKIEKVPNIPTSSVQQTKSDCTPHSNSKGNLLKAVLQSNFVKNYKLSQKNPNEDNSIKDELINISERLSDEDLSVDHKSLLQNLTNSNPVLKSDDKTLALVPFENALVIQPIIKTIPKNLSNLSLNDKFKVDINSDAEHPQVADSQNLSVQSCEISPISQIISNVSKCHFVRTSNKEDKKEVFEDNSLKLLIPENKDISTSKTIKDLQEIEESNKVHLIQNKICNKNNDQKSINCKVELNCDKNCVDLCNQEIKQDFFHENLNDPIFSLDDSDISAKKSEEMTFVTSLSVNYQRNKLSNLENVLKEKKSYVLENSSLENESSELKIETDNESHRSILLEKPCEVENIDKIKETCELESMSDSISSDLQSIISENKALKMENTMLENVRILENRSHEPGNIVTENGSCKLEDDLPQKETREIENVIPENGSFGLEDVIPENGSFGLEDVIPENGSFGLEDVIPENGSFGFEDVIPENGSCEFENVIPDKECCGLENVILCNESCELENESHEFENVMPDYKSCKLQNDILENVENVLLENETCGLENVMPDKESCKLENDIPEKESCELLENAIPENDSCKLENVIPEKESSELQNTMLANRSENAIPENEIDIFEHVMTKKDSGELQNVMSENESIIFENTTPENETYELENGMLNNESFELENTTSKNKSDKFKNIFPASRSQKFGKSLQAKEFHNIENALQKKISSKVDGILLKNTSEFKNSLQKNEFYDLQENMLKNELKDSVHTKEKETVENNESCEIKNIDHKNEVCQLTLSNPNNNIMCRVCQRNLDSMEILSKHLKDFHDIPVLKKHISEHSSQKKSSHSQDIKLSPPKLKLGTNESDSESMSDFDSPQNWSKITSDISSQSTSKNKILPEDKLHTISIQDRVADLSNLSSSLTGSFKLIKSLNKSSEAGILSDAQSLSSPVGNLNYQKVSVLLNKSRRHSFDDACSVVPLKHSDNSSEHLKSKLYRSGKKKSISLPNIKIILPSIAPNKIKYNLSSEPLIVKNIYVESSLSEDASFSSINDSIEDCKSLYESSLSSASSSQNNTVPLNEITINSNILLPNRVVCRSVPRVHPRKMILQSKLSGRKLIIQRLKTYKRKYKRKSKLKFSRQKIKSNKTFKPIIVTLKEATEVDKFLETHKQPIVKLIRLKENEFDSLSNGKTSPISPIKLDKINMEAIVKLEKIHIPKIMNETSFIEKEKILPNLLQQNILKSVRSHKTVKNSHKSYPKLRNKTVPRKIKRMHNLSDESIEISDEDSSDSVQFLKTVTKEEKLRVTSEFCPTPATKECLVVLNRLSI